MYLVAFSYDFRDWHTVEAPLPHSMDDVLQMIGEFAQPEVDGRCCGRPDAQVLVRDVETGRDVTEDALIAFAKLMQERRGEWPWWLTDYPPDPAVRWAAE